MGEIAAVGVGGFWGACFIKNTSKRSVYCYYEPVVKRLRMSMEDLSVVSSIVIRRSRSDNFIPLRFDLG